MKCSVFLSHSSHDNAVAIKIVKNLESRGISCWFDRAVLDNNIRSGLDYAASIVDAIDNASVFVVVLSNESVESEHVKNEISLAHEHIKDGMLIVPFQIMQDYPSSSFRYFLARTNYIDGKTPPIDLRIDHLCALVEDALRSMDENGESVVAQREALRKLGRPISVRDAELADAYIDTYGPQKLARKLNKATQEIDRYYRESSDPYATYAYYSEYMLESCSLAALMERLYHSGMYSIALGSVYRSLSYFLINSGKVAFVQDARSYLERAINVFNRVFDNSPDEAEEVIENIIFCQWLLSITHKQEKNYGLSNSVLEGLLIYAEEMKNEYDLPYEKTVLLPKRELAIVNQNGDIFDELLEEMEIFADDPEETFYTYRRAFEFYVYEENYEKATVLKKKTADAFERAKGMLYGIYYYAMQVNVFQYYCHFGMAEEADELYAWLIKELDAHHFDRYARKVRKDRENFLSGRRLKGYSDV